MNLKNYLPILQWLPTYKNSDFRSDLIAGITVVIMLVPQGMAYAFLAGMPPIYGLYGGLIPLFLYALLGTSRQMSIGPVAVSALLVLAGVSQLEEPGTHKYIELVILAGLLIGIVQVAMSLFRLGFLVNFLSHPVLVGFTSAAAIIIAVSQLKDLLGFHIPRFALTSDTFLYATRHLSETNWVTVIMCLGSILTIVVLRMVRKSFPGALLVVVVGTLLAWGLNLEAQGLDIVKTVPEGLPAFTMPVFSLEAVRSLVPVVLTVTIIGVVESISIAKVLEAKHSDYDVRPNQELLALGLSKIGGAFFRALPTSGSFTRSAVNNDSGAKTGMASIVTALLIGLTLLFFTPLFYYLPKAVLAAIILLAVKSLFDFKEAVHLLKTHPQDFVMMLVTFAITLIFGIEQGVMAGVVLSVFAVLLKSSKPHIVMLGNIEGTDVYRNVNRFKELKQLDDVLIVRFDNLLYFANATQFKDTIRSMVKAKGDKLKLVILDARSIHDIDSTGLHALEEMHLYLRKMGIKFYLSSVIGPVRDFLVKTGMMERIGHENQFMRVKDAVTFYQTQSRDQIKYDSGDAVQNNVKK